MYQLLQEQILGQSESLAELRQYCARKGKLEMYKWEYNLQGTWGTGTFASLTCNVLFNFEFYIISILEENNGDDQKPEDLN